MTSTCFTQSCEQIISGRYLTYDRVLEILQNEEYLSYANSQFVDRRRLRLPGRKVKSRSRHKRSLAGRGVFRDIINEYLYPGAEIKPNAGLIYAAVLALVAVPLMMATARSLPEIRSGEAPPSSHQPGTYWGGDRMDNLDNLFLGEALSLVPEGLKSVAIFPPFAQQRSIPAVAAIFSESQQISQRRRSKRSIFNIFTNWERNMLCLQPRISRRFNFRGKRDSRMDSFDDCFDDMQEPLYGYVVKMQLKQDEPCHLKTCLSHLNLTNSEYPRQTYIEGFDFIYPPDCKIKN